MRLELAENNSDNNNDQVEVSFLENVIRLDIERIVFG